MKAVANHHGGHRHARARARKHLIRVRAAVLCGRVLQEKEPNACCVHCANPRRSRSGEGDARLVALLRSLHTYMYAKERWAKSSAGARERNSTSKIRLRRAGGTHHYNFPLSAREHNSKHVASPARKRKPPAPACLFRPPRGGQGLRASASTRNR